MVSVKKNRTFGVTNLKLLRYVRICEADRAVTIFSVNDTKNLCSGNNFVSAR